MDKLVEDHPDHAVVPPMDDAEFTQLTLQEALGVILVRAGQALDQGEEAA